MPRVRRALNVFFPLLLITVSGVIFARTARILTSRCAPDLTLVLELDVADDGTSRVVKMHREISDELPEHFAEYRFVERVRGSDIVPEIMTSELLVGSVPPDAAPSLLDVVRRENPATVLTPTALQSRRFREQPTIALWRIIAVVLGLTGVAIGAWRLSGPLRRAVNERSAREDGRCPTCGYDVRHTETTCPECGRALS